MYKFLFFLILLFIQLFKIFQAEAIGINAKVISCHDGDTCLINFKSNFFLNVRLACLDAPEIGQPYSKDAKNFLNKKLGNQTVTIYQKEIDKFLRPIAYIYLKDENINHLLIKTGLAEVYDGKTSYSKKECYRHELIAKSKKMGIWKLKKRISPSKYRKRKSNKFKK